jgi:hypothetical protein
MEFVRNAVVAGSFYPADPQQLGQHVQALLERAAPSAAPAKAIVAPHAGYIYSGPIAASAYARVSGLRRQVSRVVLVGPSHRVAFQGVATSSAEAFQTPLGKVPVDRQAVQSILGIDGVVAFDAAHAHEHSLEVHLPFLQTVFEGFSLIPLVIGDCPAEVVASVLDALWGGLETLLVISSDLSHYLDYAAAQAIDRQTCGAIERLDPDAIGEDQACGRVPVRGLLLAAKRRAMHVETLDLRNSGDTAGPRDRVVGYGAWAFSDQSGSATETIAEGFQRLAPRLLSIARSAIEAKLGIARQPLSLQHEPPALRGPGASFVTLKRQGELRGCIGSVLAWQPLAADVADNAVKAAFHDPRFLPLSPGELADIDISISILTPPQPMTFFDEQDLLSQLRPRVDGLIIEDGNHRALFLPAVWESLPDPRDFLDHLKRKAGLRSNHWSPAFTARRFTAIELK